MDDSKDFLRPFHSFIRTWKHHSSFVAHASILSYNISRFSAKWAQAYDTVEWWAEVKYVIIIIIITTQAPLMCVCVLFHVIRTKLNVFVFLATILRRTCVVPMRMHSSRAACMSGQVDPRTRHFLSYLFAAAGYEPRPRHGSTVSTFAKLQICRYAFSTNCSWRWHSMSDTIQMKWISSNAANLFKIAIFFHFSVTITLTHQLSSIPPYMPDVNTCTLNTEERKFNLRFVIYFSFSHFTCAAAFRLSKFRSFGER